MNGSFEPAWLRVAVVIAAVVGVILAIWLFWALAATGPPAG